MRRALLTLSVILTPLMASCGTAGRALPPPPSKPLPTWVAADFDCGGEPVAPPQQTTKATAENYQVDTLEWGRSCHTMLNARGADAARYGLTGAK